MATTLEQLVVKSAEDVRADYLRVYSNELINRGVPNPVVSEGTEIHAHATALGQQIAAAAANVPIAANAQMPDSALGDDLLRVAKMYKLTLRPAGGSTGFALAVTTLGAGVKAAFTTGLQLLDGGGLTYTVSTGGQYATGDPIPIASSSTGESTNVADGATLRWTAPPPFVTTTATALSMTGGVDAETIEGLRTRLLDILANPQNGVNWPAANLAAEATSTAIQKSFDYPAANGPSTLHMAVTRAPTKTNKHRDVDALVMASAVVPGIIAWGNEFFDIVMTTVANVAVDVAIGLALPSSPTASPIGPGGGWIDAVPFPVLASPGYAAITTVTSSVIVVVDSDSPPVVDGQVCWLSTDDWIPRTVKIVSFTGSGPYTITVDTPLVSSNAVLVQVDDWLSPAAERSDAYYAAALTGFSLLGPGEKTNVLGLLPRALRHPYPSQSYPSELKRQFLRIFSDAGPEVSDVSYLYQSATTPALPSAITDPPKIFVPRQIGFYPLT